MGYLAAGKLVLVALFGLACWPFAAFARYVTRDEEAFTQIVMRFYRGMLRILGIRVTVEGGRLVTGPALIASNHVSYLDIVILGSLFPLRFTPKKEIAGWPVIGAGCRFCRAIFVDRRPSGLKSLQPQLRDAFAEGAIISVFPEGTTGNGLRPLPFRSGFFQAAVEGEPPVPVQPVVIDYRKIRGLPIDSNQWHSVAWYGDMELWRHFKQLVALGPIAVTVHCLPVQSGSDRRQLAEGVEAAVHNALAK